MSALNFEYIHSCLRHFSQRELHVKVLGAKRQRTSPGSRIPGGGCGWNVGRRGVRRVRLGM